MLKMKRIEAEYNETGWGFGFILRNGGILIFLYRVAYTVTWGKE